MGRRLGEAIEATLDELESKDARTAQKFRRLYEAYLSDGHNTGWRNQPDTFRTGVFGQLLGDMLNALDQ